MKRIAALLLITLPVCAQDYKIAIIGMVHSHVWGHFKPMLDGKGEIVLVAPVTSSVVFDRNGHRSTPALADQGFVRAAASQPCRDRTDREC